MKTSKFSLTLLALLAACGPDFTPPENSTDESLQLAAEAFQTRDAVAEKGSGSTTKTVTTSTYELKTTDGHSSGITPTWSSSFAIASTYELYFATDINTRLRGHHTETVFVSMPGGSAYQRFDVSFATDVVAAPGEQQAEKTSTGWRVWVSMPVAGTMIEQYSLTGGWTASVYVDGSATSAANAAFTLQ